MENLEQIKKLSPNIERIGRSHLTWSNKYVYKFETRQYLESIDDLSSMTSYTYNEIKQMRIDSLVDRFRIELNQVIFGDPAGKDYAEELMLIKKEEVKEFLEKSNNIKESVLYVLNNFFPDDIKSELVDYADVLREIKSDIKNGGK